ncbi:MAG: patatin-like phospholipase family protein [Ktedonobacterales bacterium]
MSQIRRPRWSSYTAFVLAGGGARGALQVGALRALLEAGEHPDVVVGTSIGSWNGACLALRPTIEGVEWLANAWLSTSTNKLLLGVDPLLNAAPQAVNFSRVVAALRRLAAGYPSLYSDAGLRQFIDRYLKGITFEDMAIPLCIIAADITTSTRAIFASGPVVPAVMASGAIPGVFPPVTIGNHVYVDGGALDNASIETALMLGARRIFVLDVGYDDASDIKPLLPNDSSGRHRAPNGMRTSSLHAMVAVLERTAQVMNRYQLSRALERVPRGIEIHVLRLGTNVGGGTLDFDKAGIWIELGYASASEYLKGVQQPDLAPGTGESANEIIVSEC